MSKQLDRVESSGALTCLNRYIQTLEQRIATVRTYAPEQDIAVDFVRAFSDADIRVRISLDTGTVCALMINMDVEKLTDVTAPLRWLAERLGKYTIDDYAELQRRAYIFHTGDPQRTVRFQVFFTAPGATACRFVQVGTKEEPVYQLMCEDVPVGGAPAEQ